MYRQSMLTVSFCVILLGTTWMCPTASAQISVPGTANIFGAGHAVPPDPGGGGGGVLPTLVTIPEGTNRTLVFSSVTGTISYCPTCDINGADGLVAVDVLPCPVWDGIAGTDFSTRRRYLVGVFLDGTEPNDPAPDSLVFADGSFVELAPDLCQVFFIGDGLTGTGSGTQQIFHIPDTATRIFLGFQDRHATTPDLPGWYDDNSGSISVMLEFNGNLTGVEDWEAHPSAHRLHQNYPNPFNATTVIRFTMEAADRVSLRVYSLDGRLVSTLLDGTVEAGFRTVRWDGRNSIGNPVASGVYLYRLQASDYIESKKMILLR